MLDVSRHAGSDAGAALNQVLTQAHGPELAELYTTDVLRRLCTLEPLGAKVACALDLGAVRAGDRSAPICELEFEYKSGDPQALFALAQAWSQHGGLWLNTISKSRRGAMLAAHQAHGHPVKAEHAKLDKRMSGERLLRATLRSALDQVLGNASEIASGSTDADHIHLLRVGLRRLRTALRELGPLTDGVNAQWERVLHDVFSRLGEVRDNETVAQTVRPLLEQAAAPRLEWHTTRATVQPAEAVRDARFQAALIGLLAFALCEMQSLDDTSHGQALNLVCKRLSKLHQQVVRGGKRFAALPAAEQHQVRKRLKRLRYLAEFVAPLWSEKAAQRYLDHLHPAQDALGMHNDVAVAAGKFREDAEHHPEALFAAGYLRGYLLTTAAQAHEALKQVAEARRFWKS